MKRRVKDKNNVLIKGRLLSKFDAKIKAEKVLKKIKKERKGKKFKLVQIDNKTWKEIRV